MQVLEHVQNQSKSKKINSLFPVSVCVCVIVGAGGYSGRVDGAVIG